MKVTPETRGEDGDTVTAIAYTAGTIDMSTVGVATGICLATTSSTAGNGAQEQIRFKVEFKTGSAGAYGVLRVFPPVFFDSAKPY